MALEALLRAAFDLSEREVLRNRLLVSEQVLVGVAPYVGCEKRRRGSSLASARASSSSSGRPS